MLLPLRHWFVALSLRRWFVPLSLRRRLVVAMTCVMMTAFIAMALFLLVGVREAAWQQHDDGLLSRACAFSALVVHDDDGYETERPRDLGHSYVEVILPDGDIDVWRTGMRS